MLDDPARQAQSDPLEHLPEPETPATGPADDAPYASLAEDVTALYEDGKTYVEAELAYQKSRLRFAGHSAKRGFAYSLGALAFLHLALVGLVVGLIIALAPMLTAFGSVAVVFGVLLVIGIVLARKASSHFDGAGSLFKGDDDEVV
ncbi:phage holin family protein [Erythrobacter litoralis]|uniref:Phage holin family protein n=1 Tax=Erythrobacter litoralis (strain HTCC2594) TaxID=314225 RepID=Q2NAQ4_ERYLH|nr:phage holin family protein [Erythrobacter litoralis]ABC63237.1 hypothetical protein ELI_05725 [Erythrobacter litoralis HTCC2594]